jgi:DNA-binding NarL/FixJ family response regulator
MFPIYVVIVDSDPRFLEIATRFLQKREEVLVYSVVSTSRDVVIQADVFEPDIVLYNLNDADPQSLAAINKLRNKFPEITIIVVSPSENENLKHSILEAGANDFVLRYAMNLEFLPAIWSLISMYQHRYGKSGIGTIPGRRNPMRVIPPSPNVSSPQWLAH